MRVDVIFGEHDENAPEDLKMAEALRFRHFQGIVAESICTWS
jgi:hypothetical protein